MNDIRQTIRRINRDLTRIIQNIILIIEIQIFSQAFENIIRKIKQDINAYTILNITNIEKYDTEIKEL